MENSEKCVGEKESGQVRVHTCAERMKYIYFLKVISKGLFCCIYKNEFFPILIRIFYLAAARKCKKGWTGVCECVLQIGFTKFTKGAVGGGR